MHSSLLVDLISIILAKCYCKPIMVVDFYSTDLLYDCEMVVVERGCYAYCC